MYGILLLLLSRVVYHNPLSEIHPLRVFFQYSLKAPPLPHLTNFPLDPQCRIFPSTDPTMTTFLHALPISLASLLLLLSVTDALTITVKAAVDEGLNHFRSECNKQQALLPELLTALQLRDLSRSITAYTAARPPYEQIETLANAFSDIDADIDARPYAFSEGEDNPSFRGFHLIERALFRDQRLDETLYLTGVTLNRSVNSLCWVLRNDRSRFSPHVTFEGAVALAYEVPAKKISSEEETWSDLSLMIFRNNFRGVWSQVNPFLETELVTSATATRLRSTYSNVERVSNLVDPLHDFNTDAGDARPYSNVSVSERARIIRSSYLFAEAVVAVRDEVLAGISSADSPDGANEDEDEDDGHIELDSMKYKKQVRAGVTTFLESCRTQQRMSSRLSSAIATGKLNAARMAYAKARPPYERIETISNSFPKLDEHIDQRPYVQPEGEKSAGWRGFHAVERALFRDNDLVAAGRGMRRLKGDVRALCNMLRKGSNDDGDSFTATRSWDGMIALAFEVPAKKIASEEETWSDLSVMIFRENLKGIRDIFMPFMEVLPPMEAAQLNEAYMNAKSLMAYVIDVGNDFDTGTKFRKYSTVETWARKEVSEKFYALGRALVAAKKSLKRA